MATVDYFLKIDGIEGESRDDKHKDEIEIESFSWGETQTGSFAVGGGAGAGKVSMQDFYFTMLVNKASPALFLACAQGDHIKNAILTCRKAGKKQQEFLKFTLSNVLISSFQIGGTGGVVPSDQISLNFAKIEVEYKEQDATGKLTGSITKWFDLKSMKGG
jgi:type VI secretion system secreted protein Hcp